jgi:hypothetical protein
VANWYGIATGTQPQHRTRTPDTPAPKTTGIPLPMQYTTNYFIYLPTSLNMMWVQGMFFLSSHAYSDTLSQCYCRPSPFHHMHMGTEYLPTPAPALDMLPHHCLRLLNTMWAQGMFNLLHTCSDLTPHFTDFLPHSFVVGTWYVSFVPFSHTEPLLPTTYLHLRQTPDMCPTHPAPCHTPDTHHMPLTI